MAYPTQTKALAAASETGLYDLGHNSKVLLVRGGFKANEPELVEYMKLVEPTPNPMNPHTFVRRRQITFGATYDFGQKTQSDQRPVSQWPEAVQMALHKTKEMARRLGFSPDMYNVVHVNYYPDGRAGIAAHADDEKQMVPGAPIFSFSLSPLPRRFRISHKNNSVADVMLNGGDILVMMGDMQKHFKHSVPPTTAKKYETSYRLNLTVRAFK